MSRFICLQQMYAGLSPDTSSRRRRLQLSCIAAAVFYCSRRCSRRLQSPVQSTTAGAGAVDDCRRRCSRRLQAPTAGAGAVDDCRRRCSRRLLLARIRRRKSLFLMYCGGYRIIHILDKRKSFRLKG